MGEAGFSNIEWAAGTILTTLTFVATCCGLIGMYLIHKVNRWNGYILLVYNITVFQFIYDISYFFLAAFKSPVCFRIYTFLNVLGGTAVTLWINVVSLLVLYTVAFLRSFDIKQHFLKVSTFIIAISTSLASVTIYVSLRYPNDSVTDWVYFWIRLGSIFANVIVYIIVAILLYPEYCLTFCGLGQAQKERQLTNELLLVLTKRLKYYPVVQIATRAAAAWWDIRYGFGSNSWTGGYTLEKQISQFLYDVTNPFAGIGFFIVFLFVQPSIYKEFQQLVGWFLTSCCCCCCCLFPLTGAWGPPAGLHSMDSSNSKVNPSSHSSSVGSGAQHSTSTTSSGAVSQNERRSFLPNILRRDVVKAKAAAKHTSQPFQKNRSYKYTDSSHAEKLLRSSLLIDPSDPTTVYNGSSLLEQQHRQHQIRPSDNAPAFPRMDTTYTHEDQDAAALYGVPSLDLPSLNSSLQSEQPPSIPSLSAFNYPPLNVHTLQHNTNDNNVQSTGRPMVTSAASSSSAAVDDLDEDLIWLEIKKRIDSVQSQQSKGSTRTPLPHSSVSTTSGSLAHSLNSTSHAPVRSPSRQSTTSLTMVPGGAGQSSRVTSTSSNYVASHPHSFGSAGGQNSLGSGVGLMSGSGRHQKGGGQGGVGDEESGPLGGL